MGEGEAGFRPVFGGGNELRSLRLVDSVQQRIGIHSLP